MRNNSEERRRHSRGNDLALRLTLGGLRWVYIYAAVLVILSMGPAVLAWVTADAGTPEEVAAGARLALLTHEFALPLGGVALAVSAHVGWFAGRAARYMSGADQPFESLRAEVARRDAQSRELLEATRKAARAADDSATSRRDVATLIHAALDAAERQAARPRASLLDPSAGESSPLPEANVAAGLRA